MGQVVGGSDFSNNNLFCRWGIVTGNGWDKIEGYDRGQTQVDWPEVRRVVWLFLGCFNLGDFLHLFVMVPLFFFYCIVFCSVLASVLHWLNRK